jgi:hypothetical protein
LLSRKRIGSKLTTLLENSRTKDMARQMAKDRISQRARELAESDSLSNDDATASKNYDSIFY